AAAPIAAPKIAAAATAYALNMVLLRLFSANGEWRIANSSGPSDNSLFTIRYSPSIASCRHAAVDQDLGAGDEARLVGGKIERRVGGVAAIAHEPERDARHPRLEQRLDVAAGALLGEPHLDHRRVQLARDHRVHPDALVGILHGGHPRELQHARLRGRVSDLR